MLQVVHDIAPRAQLAFCPGGAPRQTVACAKRLIDRFHAAIVVDDINPRPVFFVPTAKARGYARLLQRHLQALFFAGVGNNGGGYYQGRGARRPCAWAHGGWMPRRSAPRGAPMIVFGSRQARRPWCCSVPTGAPRTPVVALRPADPPASS